jgi:zinc transport system permease protein
MLAVFAAAAPEPHWLDRFLFWVAGFAPPGTQFGDVISLRAFVALVLACLACGALGSLVVGGRMAFFSDALAHGSFASVSIGFVMFTTLLAHRPANEFWDWVTPVMVAFAMLVGYGIAAVRHRTGLSSDTVIGVFFASSQGLAATLRGVIQSRKLFSLEAFLFGDPLQVDAPGVLLLAAQVVLVAVVLAFIYNSLLLAGFNTSLALSRRVPARLASYVFVMLLAVVVTLCVRTIGVLLINALLVVPAATACNLARNLRQLFWWTVGLCVFAGVAGQVIAWEVEANLFAGSEVRIGVSGTVILVCVALFGASLALPPLWRLRRRRTPSEAEG